MAERAIGLSRIASTAMTVEKCISIKVTTPGAYCTVTFNSSAITYSGTISIDWGDGTKNSSFTHWFEYSGSYLIRIYGNITKVGDADLPFVSSGENYIKEMCFNSPVSMVVGKRIIYGTASNLIRAVVFGENVTSVNDEYSNTPLFGIDTHISTVKFLNQECILGRDAFMGYDSAAIDSSLHIGSISIPLECEEILEYCFSRCSDITHIILPSKVKYLFAHSFAYCTGMTEFIPSTSLSWVDDAVFYNCTSLTSLDFSNTAITTFKNAVSRCSALKTLKLPSTVEYVYGFSECDITNVYIYATTPPTLDDVLQPSGSSTHYIHVPSGSVSAYNASSLWASSGTIVGDL